MLTRICLLMLLCPVGMAVAQDEPVDAPVEPAEPDQAAEPLVLADQPRESVVAMLDDADFAVRQRAEGHLLTDDTLGREQLRGLLAGAVSDEQRYRLLRVAEHHVMREARERAFGQQAQDNNEDADADPRQALLGLRQRDTAAVGFSYAPVLPGEHPIDNVSGVTIIATMPGFPGHAYLRPGDTIIAIDANPAANRPVGQEVTAWISWRISVHQPGDTISFTVIRDGRAKTHSFKCAKSSALNQMYSTDGFKAASRSARYEQIWQQAREQLVKDLPEPEVLTPGP